MLLNQMVILTHFKEYKMLRSRSCLYNLRLFFHKFECVRCVNFSSILHYEFIKFCRHLCGYDPYISKESDTLCLGFPNYAGRPQICASATSVTPRRSVKCSSSYQSYLSTCKFYIFLCALIAKYIHISTNRTSRVCIVGNGQILQWGLVSKINILWSWDKKNVLMLKRG